MDDENAVLDALQAGLEAACAGRLVGRNLLPHAQRTYDDLVAGVVTVVMDGEHGYANHRGREAQLGKMGVKIVGQLRVADDQTPLDVERAEIALANEIKAFLSGALPAPVRQCLAAGFEQGGQIGYPFGWVIFDCEVM